MRSTAFSSWRPARPRRQAAALPASPSTSPLKIWASPQRAPRRSPSLPALVISPTRAMRLGKAIDSIQAAAAVNQLSLTRDETARLSDAIKDLAGVSSGDAAEIARAFLAIGEGGATLAPIVSVYLPQLAEGMGEKAPAAAQKLAAMFTELATKGRAYVADTSGVSAATLQAYDAYIAAGEKGKAYSTIIDAMISRLEASRDAHMTARASTISHAVALGAAAAGVTDLSAVERAESQVVSEVTGKYDAATAACARCKASSVRPPRPPAIFRALSTLRPSSTRSAATSPRRPAKSS